MYRELREGNENTLERSCSVEALYNVMENIREVRVCSLEKVCDIASGRDTLARNTCTKTMAESSFGLLLKHPQGK